MTALTPQQKDAQATARRRVRRIRDGIKSYIHTLGDISAAYAAEDWKTLGYPSWAAYVAKEFGAREVGLPPEQRQKAIDELRLGGMPNRAIAAALNVDEKTVRNDRAGAEYSAPIEGEIVDSPARSPLVEAMTGAIEDAAERAADHSTVAGPSEPVEVQPSTGAAGAVSGHPAPAAPDLSGVSGGTGAPAPMEEAGRSSQGQVPASSDQAATAYRVDTAVASPGVPANTPGPAETSTAGATGAGPTPAPVADITDPGVAAPAGSGPSSPEPGPFRGGREREDASRLTPDGAPSRDDLVPTPVGPMSPAVAAAIGADLNAAWRKQFFSAIVAARKVMRAEVEDVVRMADDEAVNELHRVARDLSSYSGRIAEQRAALHPNVTPIRRAK